MIPLGTDVDLFVRCDDDRIALRKTLGVLDTDLVIVFTGKLTHKKAPHLVVEALEQNRYVSDLQLFVSLCWGF
jgi:glycosyltransferase involved in cell wall biosynthesis